MNTLTKKFTNLPANTDLFTYGDILDDIALEFGDYYKMRLQNKQSIPISVDLLCDNDVQWQFRCVYGKVSAWNDSIGTGSGVFSFSSKSIAQMIPSVTVTGTITFKLE